MRKSYLSKKDMGIKLGVFGVGDKKEVIRIWNNLYKF